MAILEEIDQVHATLEALLLLQDNVFTKLQMCSFNL